MASRAALHDLVGPGDRLSDQAVTPRPAPARPLDPLIAALSQASKRSSPQKPRDRDPDAAD